jgi:hypothetical protein
MRWYKIYSPHEELWWSNELGWADLDSATMFTEEEHTWMNLPIGGTWVCVCRED